MEPQRAISTAYFICFTEISSIFASQSFCNRPSTVLYYSAVSPVLVAVIFHIDMKEIHNHGDRIPFLGDEVKQQLLYYGKYWNNTGRLGIFMGSEWNIIVYLCRFLKIPRQRVDHDFGSEYNGVDSYVLTE